MICPTCGAYVDQGVSSCPHCQGPLSSDPIKPPGSKAWIKGCSVCGCGCLVVLLIIVGLFGYGLFKIWRVIEKQMETEPLIIEQAHLDDVEADLLKETFAAIGDALAQERQETFEITLDEAEFNYLIQTLLQDEELSFQNQLKLGVSILDDDWLKWKFSFKVDDTRYLNGVFTCFIKLENETGEFRVRDFRLGNFSLQNEEITDLNRNVFTQQNIDNVIEGYTQPSEAPFIIEHFSVKEMKAFIVLQTQGR